MITAHTQTHTHKHTHTNTQTHKHTNTHTHIYTDTHTHAHTRTRIHTSINRKYILQCGYIVAVYNNRLTFLCVCSCIC